MDEITNTLRAVINTLNTVSVTGRDNMDRLLGSILALERCVAQATAPKEPEAAKQDEN